MIDDAVLFLRQHLSSALKNLSGAAPEDLAEEPVVFVDDAKMDYVTFKPGAVSVLLVNSPLDRILQYHSPVPIPALRRPQQSRYSPLSAEKSPWK
jgi:hypothetical protein